ncbi:serpin family protein [Thermococcus atlanticus]
MGVRAKAIVIILSVIVLASGCVTAPQSDMEPHSAPNTSNDVLSPMRTPEVQGIADASNLFAFQLYRRLGPGNIFFSPFSIFTALAMVYEGAAGKTAEEMEGTLHLPANASLRREAFRTVLLDAENPTGLNLKIANALWVQRDFPVKKSYLDVIERYYLGYVEEVDFKQNPREAEKEINRWVEECTNGRIRNLVSGLSRLTRLVITNAVYFKANWSLRFNPNDTHNGTFKLPSGKTVLVPMMHRRGRFGYYETDDLQVLEMPYESDINHRFSMLIILPKKANGLGDVEEKLTPQFLEEIINSIAPQKVDVTVPKFKFEASYSLKEPLMEMGIREAFNRADFSGISGKPLAISEVVHKSFISVAENGTEAAAATAITLTAAAPPGEEQKYKVFKADHPFIFMIINRESGMVIFMGRLVDPEG